CVIQLSLYSFLFLYFSCHPHFLSSSPPRRSSDLRIPTPPERKKNHRSICIVVPRVVFEAVGGFDEGYRGWGAEDDAFWHAATIAAGDPQRVAGVAYHLHHKPASTRQERAKDP